MERIEPTSPRLEDAVAALLHGTGGSSFSADPPDADDLPEVRGAPGEEVVVVRDLVRDFGAFRAVDHVSLAVRRGEVFGLLGPNGAGKSTIFRIMCGLLPPTSGTARVLGIDLRRAAPEARARIGYMAQKFTLYGDLTVRQNLLFFAAAYGLGPIERRRRVRAVIRRFGLSEVANRRARDLSLGHERRLAMAAALVHRPEILFLDEPTSGVDLPGRRAFWQRIGELAERGVTVVVTTHFLDEAEYCDRVAIVDRGRGGGAGAGARSRRRDAGGRLRGAAARPAGAGFGEGGMTAAGMRRLRGLLRKEILQILRDPSSVAIAFVLPLLLLFVLGYGVSLDPRRIPVGVVIDDSRAVGALLAGLRGSPWFEVYVARTRQPLEAMLARGELRAVLVPQHDMEARLAAGEGRVQILLDGVDANTARLTENHLRAVVGLWLARLDRPPGAVAPVPRVWFNTTAESRNFLVPGLAVVVLSLTGALLTAMVLAREWERGTVEVLVASPARRAEIFLAKLLPYVVLGMGAFAVVTAAAVFVFGVPLRGSLPVLAGVGLLYVVVSCGWGLFVSGAARDQFVAAQIVLFSSLLPAFMLSGFLFDIASMPVWLQWLTVLVPARWFVSSAQTLHLAGVVPEIVLRDVAVLAAMAAGVLILAWRRIPRRLDG